MKQADLKCSQRSTAESLCLASGLSALLMILMVLIYCNMMVVNYDGCKLFNLMLEAIFNYLICICSFMLLPILIYDTNPTIISLLVNLFSTVDLHKRSMHTTRNYLTSSN